MNSFKTFLEFYKNILWKLDREFRLIIWKSTEKEIYKEYSPKQFYPRIILISVLSLFIVIIFGLTLFSVHLGIIPSMDLPEFRQRSVLTSIRLQQISDSLDVQAQYLSNLRILLSGHADTLFDDVTYPSLTSTLPSGRELDRTSSSVYIPTDQSYIPISPMTWTFPRQSSQEPMSPNPLHHLMPLQLPLSPPVQGIITRTFEAEVGHYAIDLATTVGSVVQSIGDGYVIFSDWTYEGGHTITIQHADGYVSVYKHNQRLLKRVGQRVQSRESIAISGDSGEFSSAPHLHFELWNNGVGQHPSTYLLGY